MTDGDFGGGAVVDGGHEEGAGPAEGAAAYGGRGERPRETITAINNLVCIRTGLYGYAPSAELGTPVHAGHVIPAGHVVGGNWFPIVSIVAQEEMARNGAVRDAAHQPIRTVPLDRADAGRIRVGSGDFEGALGVICDIGIAVFALTKNGVFAVVIRDTDVVGKHLLPVGAAVVGDVVGADDTVGGELEWVLHSR